MKAKFLSVLLALTMVLSLLPTAVLASAGEGCTDENCTHVAAIGDMHYDSLQDAIDAAQNGATVKLLNNIDLGLTVSVGKKIILDMNGKKISNTTDLWDKPDAKANNWSLISVRKNGDLTIIGDGTLDAKENDCYAIDLQDETSKCTIENGTFIGNVHAVYVERGELIVNGGSYSIQQKYPDSNLADEFVLNCYDPSRREGTATITVSGGSFVSFNPADCKAEGAGTNFCAKGYTSIKDESANTYTVVSGKNSAVANAGANYNSLANAITSVKKDAKGTVTLLTDTTEDVVIPAGKDITLDLNGKTLTNADDHTIINNGTLTITGDGTVDNTSNGKAALYNNAGAKATLNSGTFDRSYEAGAAYNDNGGNSFYTLKNFGTMIINAGVTVQQDGTNHGGTLGRYSSLIANGWQDANKANAGKNGEPKVPEDGAILTINGGSFIGGLNTIKNDDCATLTINDGTFTNYTQAAFMNHHIATVNNGKFIADSLYAIYNCGCDATNDIGKLTIKDGTFTGELYVCGDYSTVTIEGGYFNGNVQKVDAGSLSITGGYFTVDPSAYVDDNHYVVESDETGYTYMVTNEKPDEVPVIVTDEVAVSIDESIKGTDANAIEAVIGRAAVENVSDALTDDAQDKLIADAGVKASELDESDTVTIVVNVAVKAVASDLSNTNNATLTFEADPTATVYVNGEKKGEAQDVSNDMLNGSITVKLPLPEGFTPKQITHKSDGYRTEYYLDHYERGAKQFDIKVVDGVNCAVFDITHFSTFVLSGTQTYVAPSRPSSSTGSTITVGKTENGTITVSPATASKGTNVTITAKPADGYELGSLTATDANGSTLALTDLGNGKYSFTMPDGKVEVNGTFVKKSAQTFVDVPENAYYAPAVNWAVEKGVTEGTSATTFSPDAACTRAQIVTFLYRAAGSPAVKSTVNPFTDVTASDYYYNAVLWAVENGITTGTSETTFSPNESCTRAQCVTFLYRAVGSAATAKAIFTDVSADAYYAPAVNWAVEKGVTEGTSATTFSPDAACTRAQIVTFLYRAAQVK